MKKSQFNVRFALGVLLTALALGTAHATPFVTSQIVGFSSGNLGAVGTAEKWNGSSGNVTVTSGSGSLSGTPLGLYPSAGDKADVSATSGQNTYNLFANSGQYPQSANNNIYYSFLYRFNTITNMSTNRIVLVTRQNSGTASHFDVEATTNASGKILIGVNKTNGTPAFAAAQINVGATFFVVVRQQIIAGGTAVLGNDVVDLWINPAPASFGVDEGSVPTPDATATIGGEDTSGTGAGRMYFPSGVSGSFDELRISTNSWADVTPPASSCVAASFDSNPVDTSVSEGISATFSVTSSSSTPIFQWQTSTNGGTSWNNVSGGSGGTTANFTTSPLGNNNNLNRYRCIATVACGGSSSATSSVAVVTVTPAVVTPVGVVLDDVFADGFRTNTPIGISNSIWRASAAASMNLLDGTGTELVGTTTAGTSRLWLGYFTDDSTTNLPVHLAVGRMIKATLVFKASNITSNGGGLRIGLFDYADNGFGTNSRPTGDAFGSGSTGNGTGVRGYMLSLDYGTNFSSNTPETISARTTISDVNLMGSAGDFVNLASGPTGATLNGAPAFENDVNYTLDFSVTRSAANTTVVSTSITGGGTNYTTSVTDTNYAYPRFDAIGIRPASLETSADNFTFSRFTVQVVAAAQSVPPFSITSIERLDASSVKLSWTSVANASYHILSRDSLTTGNWTTNATVAATSASTSYTNTGIGPIPQRYYRVIGLPYTP